MEKDKKKAKEKKREEKKNEELESLSSSPQIRRIKKKFVHTKEFIEAFWA